jgi:ribosome biogenesis ATPase
LTALASEAGSIAIKRILSKVDPESVVPMEQEGEQNTLLTDVQIKELFITMQDFEQAIKKVQPSAKREGFATIPNVSWNDVGALQDVRKELANYVIQPIKTPERFAQLGLDAPAGILLYGPPGCGKTLLAKAIANDCGTLFMCRLLN